MTSASERDRFFPLSSGSTERTIWHAPRLLSEIKATPGIVMGNRAFMRAWAARRAAKMSRPSVRPEGTPGSSS